MANWLRGKFGKKQPMGGTLLLNILNISSDSVDHTELADLDNAEVDTCQFWVSGVKAFMITTYALNLDVRIFRFPPKPDHSPEVLLSVFDDVSSKRYADVMNRQFRLEFENVYDVDEVARKFREIGLEPTIGYEDDLIYWRPGNAEYKQLSQAMEGNLKGKLPFHLMKSD